MLKNIKDILKKINENIILFVCIVPFAEIFAIEWLHRRSLIETADFIVNNPKAFLINVFLLMGMSALCFLFRERLFWAFLVDFIWMFLGVVNYFVLSNRVSPFSYTDIKLLSSIISIFRQYLNKYQMVLVIIFILFCILIMIYLYYRIPKVDRKKHILRDVISAVIVIGLGFFAYNAGGEIFIHTGNITLTYKQSGFVYSFTNSVFDVGIQRPLDYRADQITDIKKSLKEFDTKGIRETKRRPNIIFVQLESFFDVNNMRDYTYSQDPMPNFHKLIDEYSSGYITVPAFGAGTVNSEFEILTGMSMDYFGLSEYPYKTILKEQCCESMAYNLREVGYSTAVIHNNKGTFYSRNSVFKNLGFQVFDPIEYMNGAEYNPIDWVKDSILPGQIVERMESTLGRDFIYTITVQSHGKYVTDDPEEPYKITIDGENNVERKNAFEYYINQCYEVDQFIGELIEEVDAVGEDSVIVFYGDHLPSLDITDSQLRGQNTYQTTYVVWDNIGLKEKNKDLNAYQLSSYILTKLGYSNGILTKYHQVYKGDKNYQKYLEMLQYDMLYGNQYVYGKVKRYEKSKMMLGLHPIIIKQVIQQTGRVLITGDNFTDSSYIYINGKKRDTERLNDHLLVTYDYELEEGDSIIVRQITSTGGKIGATEEWVYLPEMIEWDMDVSETLDE